MSKTLHLVTLLILIAPAIGEADDGLPKSPDGFQWERVDTLNVSYLVPDGWFFNVETLPGTIAVFITKEDYHKEGEFKTGMSINVYPEFGKSLKDKSIDEFANDIIEQLSTIYTIDSSWQREVGEKLTQYGAIGSKMSKEGEVIIIYSLAIANKETGTLYGFNFETRRPVIKSEWPKGMMMANYIMVDDDI